MPEVSSLFGNKDSRSGLQPPEAQAEAPEPGSTARRSKQSREHVAIFIVAFEGESS